MALSAVGLCPVPQGLSSPAASSPVGAALGSAAAQGCSGWAAFGVYGAALELFLRAGATAGGFGSCLFSVHVHPHRARVHKED